MAHQTYVSQQSNSRRQLYSAITYPVALVIKETLCLQKNLFVGILLGNTLIEVGGVGVNLSTGEHRVECILSPCNL